MNIGIELREYINLIEIEDNLLTLICINCFKSKFKFLERYENLIINTKEKLEDLINNYKKIE